MTDEPAGARQRTGAGSVGTGVPTGPGDQQELRPQPILAP